MIYILTGIVSAIFFFKMIRNGMEKYLYKKWVRFTLDLGVTLILLAILKDSAGGALISLTTGATYTMLNEYYYKIN